ncbi:hypothetical protein GH714_026004 [Hevea brasiliensis]|uniref:Uncharacterized protein n=1 Tax=Hevea brasiliensis TaxID=3981 RepID=A0A6A6KUB4_HEVBR|nr:hypothetical protein GH714_026004 [Hevea brasiliensis]
MLAAEAYFCLSCCAVFLLDLSLSTSFITTSKAENLGLFQSSAAGCVGLGRCGNPASTQGDENSEHMNDGEDQSMSSEEDDANKNKAKTTNSRQNEKLYAVEVDYVKKKGSAIDVEDESGKKDDDDQITGEVPMSGVKFDDE